MFKTAIFLSLTFHLCVESVEFVLFTQPKTGTHLLIPILTELTKKNVYWAPEHTKNVDVLLESFEEAITNPVHFFFNIQKAPWTRQMMDLVWETNKKNNTFLHLHAPYSVAMEAYLAEKHCVSFFVTRDPRDQIVSLLNHYKHIHFNDKEVELISGDDERLLRMIRKDSKIQTTHYMNWRYSSNCCVLNFEKLMGAHGGVATQAEAMAEMRKIAAALQLSIPDHELMTLYRKHFGHGWSFFKGKVGTWKLCFNESHKTAIKEEIGDLLIELGYEEHLDW